ncbi:MAG: hypothetical protein SGI87_10865, partial [Flavobacteriales bacterium]|nr:hypothetical protein [Flavobacteriales bacterium]
LISGDISICLGQSTQLCVAPGFASYLWSNGETTNCISVSTAGIYSVVVQVVFGCESTCSVEVFVSDNPVCLISGNLSICEGQSAQLCVAAGFASYLWSNGSTSNCIVVSEPGEYFVVVQGSVGCEMTCSAIVEMFELPICEITGGLITCEDQVATICAQDGFASYLWSTGATSICIEITMPGSYSVTVTNIYGCSSTCETIVNEIPNNIPVADIMTPIEIECIELIPDIYPTFTDEDGDILQIECSEQLILEECGYTIVRTCTATDLCGASATSMLIIHVTDTFAPIFEEQPPVLSMPCESWTFPGATDNCDLDVEVTLLSMYPLSGECNSWWQATFIAVDDCGNSDTLNVLLHLYDNVGPVFLNVPQDSLLVCDGIIPEVPNVTAYDECGDVLSIEFTEVDSGSGCEAGITRTWTAIDNCGNMSVASYTIYIDNQAPIFEIVPGVLEISCADWGPLYYPTAADSCDVDVDVELLTFYPLSGECNNWWQATFIAFDDCGNSDTLSVLLDLYDNVGPLFLNVPQDTLLICDGIIPEVPNVTAYDECGDVLSIEFTEVDSGSGCDAGLTRIWTAIDNCGNMSVASYTIYMDTQAPVFESILGVLEVSCSEWGPLSYPIALDSCDVNVDIELLTFYPLSGSCNSWWSATFLAADDCGNTDSLSILVHLIDTMAPNILNVPQDLVLECGEEVPPVPLNVTAEDNCGEVESIIFEETFTGVGCDLNIVRTWTATDCSGNEVAVSQNISFQDLDGGIPGTNPIAYLSVDITDVFPNPTNVTSTVTITTAEFGEMELVCISTVSNHVARIFKGKMMAGEIRSFQTPSTLPDGVYCIKLINTTTGEGDSEMLLVE